MQCCRLRRDDVVLCAAGVYVPAVVCAVRSLRIARENVSDHLMQRRCEAVGRLYACVRVPIVKCTW